MMSRIRRYLRVRSAVSYATSLSRLREVYVRESVRPGNEGEAATADFLRSVIDRLSLSELAEMYNQCLDDGMPVVFGDVTRVGVYRVTGVTEREIEAGERSAALLRDRVFRWVVSTTSG